MMEPLSKAFLLLDLARRTQRQADTLLQQAEEMVPSNQRGLWDERLRYLEYRKPLTPTGFHIQELVDKVIALNDSCTEEE